MQNPTEPGGNPSQDPFAELVRAVRQSIFSSLPDNPSAIPEAILHSARQHQLPQTPATSPAASASPMARPAPFSGEAEDCSGFLLQVSLYFQMQAHQFTDDSARVAFIISLLSGRALQWAQSLWNSDSPVLKSLSGFISHFKEVFGQAVSDLSVHDQLYNLRQGNSSVSTYALQFRTLAASCGWNESALITAFRHGLNPNIRQLLVVYDDSMGIENLIQKTIRVSQRLSACDNPSTAVSPPSSIPIASPPAPEPMQVDSTHLTPSERQRCIQLHLCLYCGSDNHLICSCPVRPQRSAVSSIQIPPKVESLNRTMVHLLTPHICVPSRLRFSGELHFNPAPPKTERPQAPQPSRAQSSNHPRKAAGSRSNQSCLSHINAPNWLFTHRRDLILGAGGVYC